ncbi:tRNA lysidine(34) synthetase TilS [Shouchella sp. 1P09AA]|uniref:tRNA lysidine(34) synthetase TilS n=1 Tax=unclassified Shouchella TaxID=2893065 RepID=UPI0039A08203
MKQQIQNFIEKNDLFKKNQTILVAVSGGADSMALLSIMEEMRVDWSLTLYAVHVNHQLRAEESEEDARFIKKRCAALHIPLEQRDVDVKTQKTKDHVGTQAAAHTVRYRAFEEVMRKVNADVLLTAHHGDDHVESTLMKLNRGTSPFRRLGIAVARNFANGKLARPLLCVDKEEILNYCRAHHIPYRDDSSNQSEVYTRNRFRKQVMPFLKEENPLSYKHIRRYEEWQYEDNELLMELANEKLKDLIVSQRDGTLTISRFGYHELAIPLQRRLIHLILNCLYNKEKVRDFSSYIEQVEHFLKNHSRFASIDLRDGLKVYRQNDCYRFTQEDSVESDNYCLELKVPGEVRTPLGIMKAEFSQTYTMEHKSSMMIPLKDLSIPFYVRNRRSGDRFCPKGLNGSKKVSRVFIDKKIDFPKRQSWPILVNGMDEILWIPLLHKAEISKQEADDHYVRITFLGNT